MVDIPKPSPSLFRKADKPTFDLSKVRDEVGRDGTRPLRSRSPFMEPSEGLADWEKELLTTTSLPSPILPDGSIDGCGCPMCKDRRGRGSDRTPNVDTCVECQRKDEAIASLKFRNSLLTKDKADLDNEADNLAKEYEAALTQIEALEARLAYAEAEVYRVWEEAA